MKKYKTILFDIDDTIIDFNIDQKKAFEEAFQAIGYHCDEEMYKDYTRINAGMWELLDEGKLSLQDLCVKRFEVFFKKYNIPEEPKKFDRLLTLGFQKTGTPMKGAKEVLERLQKDFELVIATNGPKDQQYHRLDNANFSQYFSKIFVSEEVGYNKPHIKYFEKVFEEIDNKDKSSILIVGDSISSDIRGGMNAGIDTCWFNRKNKDNHSHFQPTYEIKELEEVFALAGV